MRRPSAPAPDRLSTSFAIEIIASTNRSSSRLLSVSVGSIISAPRTISGKLTV